MSEALTVFFKPEDASTFPRGICVAGRSHATVEYVKTQGYVERRGERSVTTSHFMYGGMYGIGKLCVPQSATMFLMDAIVKDFSVGVYMALTENKPYGKPMRLYIDYDFTFSDLEGKERLWEVAERAQQEELARFFPGVNPASSFFDAMVLASGAKKCEDGYKCGVHVIFQNVFVDVDMALYITSAIINRLEAEARMASEPMGIWAKRIDQAVYADGRGLRMPWQLKTTKCRACDGEGTKRGCHACSAGVIIDTSASMYAPVYTCKGVACRREAIACQRDTPTVELMMAASIRAVVRDTPSEGFVLYPGHPPLPSLVAKRGAAVNGVKQFGVVMSGDVHSTHEELLMPADPRFGALLSAIRRAHDMYTNIQIQKAVVKARGFAVAVQGPGACFCLNYGKDHNKQRVKFFVTIGGVTQYCHCRCDIVRPSGKRCRDFASERFALLDGERRVLFPGVATSSQLTAESMIRPPVAASVDTSNIDSDIVKACLTAPSATAGSSETLQSMTPMEKATLFASSKARFLKRK